MTLRKARKYGVALITGSLGLGVFLLEGQQIIQQPSIPLKDYLYLANLIVIGGLIFGWVWATDYEIGLQIWLNPKNYKIPSDTKETATIMLLGLTLVSLFFTARNPLFFSTAFLIYSNVVTLAVFHMNTNELPRAFEDTRRNLRDNPMNWQSEIISKRLEALDQIEYYFLKRPHTIRHILIIDFAFLACASAIAWKTQAKEVWGNIAYIALFLTIVVSEVVIIRWRIIRDNRLRPINESLQSMGHYVETINKDTEE